MEEKNKETITFEVIREIQLKEKREAKLTKLPENFYEKARDYLMKKFELARINPDTRFLIEAKNVKRIIEEIFYQRERKIILQAFIYIKTGLMPENMTPEEFEFFKAIVDLIKKRREKYLSPFLEVKKSFEIEEKQEKEEKLKEEEIREEKKELEKKKEEKEVKEEEEIAERKKEVKKGEEKEKSVEIKEEKKVKKVLMKISLPQFLGLDGKEYGPFKEGEIVELPIELADLLIKKHAAEEYIE